jgi:hypothetical protein
MNKFIFKQRNELNKKKSLFSIRKNNSLITNHYVYNESLTKIDLMKKDCFWNQCFDKSRLKNFVLWFLLNHEEHKTVELVEQLKNLGFKYATKAGISLGIDDLKIPPKKAELILEAEKLTLLTVNEYKRGEITGVERFQRLIDTWHRTSERLKQEVIDHFEATDILNPVYMMAFSGARGNISQVRQLVGMRGLMANPQGQIIDFPIRSNFREGLTLTEYIISSYGARKGIVDTALRTANAGYLTRRLVDVAQHVIISNFDCETRRGIFLTDMKEGNKTIYSLQNRLVGRVLARDIYSLIPDTKVNSKKSGEKHTLSSEYSSFAKDKETSSNFTIAKRNTEISLDLAFEISKAHKKVFVRSALTCQTKKLVCQLCYGWSLAQGNLVSIGEAVGVVAAQSIGEPGTQLTMRTFHTGGVFSGDVTDQIKAPFDGFVEYDEPIAGTLIRTPEGKIAFLTKNEGSFLIYKKSNSQTSNVLLDKETAVKSKKYKIPAYTLVFKRMGETVFEKEVIAQISSISRQKNSTDDAELTIKSEIEGQFYSKILDLQENKVGPKSKKEEQGFLISSENYSKAQNNLLLGNDVVMDTLYEAWNWGYAWILSGKIYQLSLPSSFFPILGDFINRKTVMNQIKWKFYTEGVGHFLQLHQSLTLPYNAKLINIPKKFNSSKNKSLISSYFRSKNSKIVNQSYSLKSLSLKNPSLKASKLEKTLENVLNIPVIKHSLLSFDIHKIFYKKSGYVVQLTKQVSSINQSESFIQPSILSKEDILLLISSLKVPQNGLSTLTNYSINSAPKDSKTYNKELDTFFNFSNSFSSSNWLPNSQFFLNWYPKNSQIPSSGLISIEQGFPTNFVFPFSKEKKTKSKGFKVDPTGLVKVLSLLKEKKYKLQLESALDLGSNRFFRLKNLDSWSNSGNLVDLTKNKSIKNKNNLKVKNQTKIENNSIINSNNEFEELKKGLRKNNIKVVTPFFNRESYSSQTKPIMSSSSLFSSVIKKEFIKKILKENKMPAGFNVTTNQKNKSIKKNLIVSLYKSDLKENQINLENNKRHLLEQRSIKKNNSSYITEKLIYSDCEAKDHPNLTINKLHFALRWKNSYNYKSGNIKSTSSKNNFSKNTLKKNQLELSSKNKQNITPGFSFNEKPLMRVFFIPQYFYQLNPTFSVLLNKNSVFNCNHKNPFFYQINKQGSVKFFYIFSTKKEQNPTNSLNKTSLPRLVYSVNIKSLKEVKTNLINLKYKNLPNPDLKILNKDKEFLFIKTLTNFILKKKQFQKDYEEKVKSLNARELKQLYNLNQFINFKSQINLVNLKKQKLRTYFKELKNNIQITGSAEGLLTEKKDSINLADEKSFIFKFDNINKKNCFYLSRLFSFSNSDCLTLKAFSKKITYISILKNKTQPDINKKEKSILKNKLTGSLKNFKGLEKTSMSNFQNKHNSIFNFCILPFVSNQINDIYPTNKKIHSRNIFSEFIQLELSKSSSFIKKKLSNFKNSFIKNRTLCSNKDIYKISQNLSFKIKKFNSIKYFLLKSILSSKTNIKRNLLKTFKQYKESKTFMLNKGMPLSNLVHFNKLPIQIKFGWIYVSTNLADNFASHKKFVFPGQIILDDLIIDSHVSYLEFISLPNQTQTNKGFENDKSIHNKIVYQVNFTYKHTIKIYFKKSTPYKSMEKEFNQDTKINSITKNLNSWGWVSNKNARYLPSNMQFPLNQDVKASPLKNNFNFAVLIRKVSEYKQYHLQNYKNDIYHFSNDKFKLLSPLNTKVSSLDSTFKDLEKSGDCRNYLNAKRLKKELFYKLYLETCLKNSSMFKFANVLINLRSFKNQPIFYNKQNLWSENFRDIKKESNSIGERLYLELFGLTSFASFASQRMQRKQAKYSSIQIFTTLNFTKKIFNFRFANQKKSFICKPYSSINLNQEFKNSLQNKQKRTLQTISKFPNIDLELSSTVGLYYARERTTYKSDLSNKYQIVQDQSFDKEITSINSIVKREQFGLLPLLLPPQGAVKKGERSKGSNQDKQNLGFYPEGKKKQLFGFRSPLRSGFNLSLPILCRKAINISPLLISYKIPYGLHGTFNTDFSFFNYKNNITFHLQEFNNSFYVTKFLQNYIFKLFFFKSQKNKMFDDKNSYKIKQKFTNEFFSQNKTISSEINSLIPVFFNCPCFSYNLIQKLDKTFMSDINLSTLTKKVSKNNIDKLTFLSKKIEIKNQFFTSKDNNFRSSDCVGKTSSYSSFEGEMIYKKDLNLFNPNKLYSKNSMNQRTKEGSLDSFFPLSNENSALILTKQDLVSFSLEKNKKIKPLLTPKKGQKEASSNYSTAEVAKKHYYINDIIIKFQKMNQLPIETENTSDNSLIKSVKGNMESVIKINKLSAGLPFQINKVFLGEFFMYGDKLNNNLAIFNTGQIIHFSKEKITLRRGQPIFISPKAILHKYDGDFVDPKSSVITLAYSQLKTGDIIQGIPKVEQFFEARTTKRGRLFRDSLPNLLKGLFKRYISKLPLDKAVRQSFYKIQQIIVDGVQRVYRAQGASIADKHLEVIVKQMTSKVRITQGAQTGFFAGEIVDLDFVEQVNTLLMKKIQYEPLVLGITKASLEVESFLSAASFQQTTRVLSKAAMGRKKDFLKGLKENVILGNLIPAGTGYLVYIEK